MAQETGKEKESSSILKKRILDQLESSPEFRDAASDILVEFYEQCTVGNPMTLLFELAEVFKSLDSELKKIC